MIRYGSGGDGSYTFLQTAAFALVRLSFRILLCANI